MEIFVASEMKYRGIIFDVTQRTVTLPNGRQAKRDIVEHNGAAAVVALTKYGEVVLVRQYREAAKDYLLEIPAGKLEAGEDPAACALRELEEETGYRAGSVRLMFKARPAAAYCTEMLYIFAATDLTQGASHPDTDEFVTALLHPLPQVLGMIESGVITDMKTIAGVLHFAQFML